MSASRTSRVTPEPGHAVGAMKAPSPVLVALEFSEQGDEALRQGAANALALAAPLVACHVLPESFRVRVLFPQDAGVDASLQEALALKARDLVRARVAAVLPPATAVTIEIDSGSPHSGILETAARVGAGLIVIGPGRAAQRVAQASSCPVLVARPSPRAGVVIGATDFSDAALPALHAAADAARWMGGGLRVIHCLDVDQAAAIAAAGAAGGAGAIALPVLSEPVFAEIRADAVAALARAQASLGTESEVAVLRRSPGRGIVEEAAATGASLVVVGTRGRTGIKRLLMGSTAEYVMSAAPCSVLVVPLHHPEPPSAVAAPEQPAIVSDIPSAPASPTTPGDGRRSP